jgi:hypothetical protein
MTTRTTSKTDARDVQEHAFLRAVFPLKMQKEEIMTKKIGVLVLSAALTFGTIAGAWAQNSGAGGGAAGAGVGGNSSGAAGGRITPSAPSPNVNPSSPNTTPQSNEPPVPPGTQGSSSGGTH